MYELCVETEFCAAHAIRIRGELEPLHGHNWRVMATLSGSTLDTDGLLVDFHEVERMLTDVVRPLTNANLNEVRELEGINPSAEMVARHIALALEERLRVFSRDGSAGGVHVASVRLTEAPGCSIVYRPRLGAPSDTTDD